MRALFVQHDHISPPGVLAERLSQHGYDVDKLVVVDEANYHSPGVSCAFPGVDDYDVVVVMGAPWGAWDDQRIGSWLSQELDWLRALNAGDVPVLGICFGGQAIARALGGSVAPAPREEIGFTTIHSEDPVLVSEGPWFQFHYDRWAVPPGAVEIARNPHASQAFVMGRTLALQFHPELDSEVLDVWALDGVLTDQVRESGQDFHVMREQVAAHDHRSWHLATKLIDGFLDRFEVGSQQRSELPLST